MKINVGDYVRTPNGVIAKIIDIKDDEGQYFINNNAISLSSKTYISDKNITIGENFKHSPNIIDLIESGDYVNGHKVIEHSYESGRLFVENIYVGGKGLTTIEDYSYELTSKYCYDEPDFIKSIVTKEQFESMKYVVKKDENAR